LIYLMSQGGIFNNDPTVENWVMLEIPYFLISGGTLVIYFEW